VTFANLREREVYEVPQGWERTPGASISTDGLFVLCGEANSGNSRLRMVRISRGVAQTVVQVPWVLTDPVMRPRRAQVMYRRGDQALWLVNADGQQNRQLKLADGRVGPARWSPDGRSIVYLNIPDDSTQLRSLREITPDANQDKLVARTSQFAHFGMNSDTSVFVGASLNRASPTILILLRLTRRELTLAEHKASDASLVAPVFSPDSQRIFFTSDRHGKPAIYRIQVEKFVEKTESETP
jgi:oligogalacturonide lyase